MILNCIGSPALDHDARISDHKCMKRELLITLSTNILKDASSLFADATIKERNVFSS